MALNRNVRDAFAQIMLRMVPIIPANEILVLLAAVSKTSLPIEKQVDEAVESLKQSAKLVDNLEKDLTQRMVALKKLQEEHEKFSQLSNVSREQARALSDLIAGTMGRNAARERVFAFLINLIAGLIIFVLGIIFSDWVRHLFGKLIT